jgi:hypothetical protein
MARFTLLSIVLISAALGPAKLSSLTEGSPIGSVPHQIHLVSRSLAFNK